MLAFCLEARFDDLIDLCGDSFFDYGAHIVVFVEHRKMNQHRQGEFVLIYDTGDSRSACALLCTDSCSFGCCWYYTAGNHLPIFRKVGTGRKRGTYLRTQALGYGRVRELVHKGADAGCWYGS